MTDRLIADPLLFLFGRFGELVKKKTLVNPAFKCFPGCISLRTHKHIAIHPSAIVDHRLDALALDSFLKCIRAYPAEQHVIAHTNAQFIIDHKYKPLEQDFLLHQGMICQCLTNSVSQTFLISHALPDIINVKRQLVQPLARGRKNGVTQRRSYRWQTRLANPAGHGTAVDNVDLNHRHFVQAH